MVFKRLFPCALEERSLSIGKIKTNWSPYNYHILSLHQGRPVAEPWWIGGGGLVNHLSARVLPLTSGQTVEIKTWTHRLRSSGEK